MEQMIPVKDWSRPRKKIPENCGVDYFGNEILSGDSIVIDIERGEVILENSLEDYLIGVLGFIFKKAE